jgi:hypothetical protein
MPRMLGGSEVFPELSSSILLATLNYLTKKI